MSATPPPVQEAGFWTLDRVHAALGDGPRGPRSLGSVSTDTRAVRADDIFVAIRGEQFDGHAFVADAVARGAAAVVVSDLSSVRLPGVAVYHVDDTVQALGRLARYRRRAWGGPLIAVAGSNGKTSTKELLRAALGSRLHVHATAGNLNNQIGVPLTLLAIPSGADIVVAEVGTNHPGEVALLRAICEPTAAVVTSIAEEHLEGFGDLAGVLAEETAIYDGVELAFAPAGFPEVVDAARRLAVRAVSAGLDDGDWRPERWTVSSDGDVEIDVEGITVKPRLRGRHNAANTVLALAVARWSGITIEDAARGLASMAEPPMRTAWTELGAATLINDAYNSNPGSARAAIDLLHGAGGGRQRVLVLGTMRELGAQAERLHDEIARAALDSGAEIVAGMGDFAGALERAAPGSTRVVTAPEVDELWRSLRPRLAADAVIMLKGSRGVRLERLLPWIHEWAGVTRAPSDPSA